MIYYGVFFLFSVITFELSAMENHRYIPSLKVLAVQRVYELGLVSDAMYQNVLDDVFVDELRYIPQHTVEKHKEAMRTRLHRDNSIAPCHNRVKERIHTYNTLEYMNKKMALR
jgi:hypothetical protein